MDKYSERSADRVGQAKIKTYNLAFPPNTQETQDTQDKPDKPDKPDIIKFLDETVEHKIFVIETSRLLSNYFISKGKTELGIAILARAFSHDNSKLTSSEIKGLSSIISTSSLACQDPNTELTEKQKEILAKHWENNRHHPEYHKGSSDMTELDIIEMVCDWYSRSKQFNTDFIDYVNNRQKNRFRFTEDTFKTVEYYCLLLQSLDSKI